MVYIVKKLEKNRFLNRNWRSRRWRSHRAKLEKSDSANGNGFEGEPAGMSLTKSGETWFWPYRWYIHRSVKRETETQRPRNCNWFYHSEEVCRYRRIGLAAAVKSDSQKPAALYKRCNAAKPRVRSWAGCAHLATKKSRETKPESCTARGDAENGAMTWLKSRGGL